MTVAATAAPDISRPTASRTVPDLPAARGSASRTVSDSPAARGSVSPSVSDSPGPRPRFFGSRPRPEIAVVGAGIVGAAVAWELAGRGARVAVYDAGELGGGATAEGMGHLLFLAESPAQFELIGRSMQRWGELVPELPPGCEVDRCGTLWLAADDEDLEVARAKTRALRSFGVEAEVVDAPQLRTLEPALAPGLVGGMRVPADAVLYPPRVVRYLLEESPVARRITVHTHTEVQAVHGADGGDHGDGGASASGSLASRARLRLADGWREFDGVVVASGVGSARLLPASGIQPRKGHLAITDRYPGFLRHQVVELAYVRNTQMGQGDTVSMNVQPRSTGQVLIGSCRQFAGLDRRVDPVILAKMIAKARAYVPAIATLQIVRIWTGFRPASPDDRPWIGAWPGSPGIWIATGHEGLGITSALGTAELLADLVVGRGTQVSPDLYRPAARLARGAA